MSPYGWFPGAGRILDAALNTPETTYPEGWSVEVSHGGDLFTAVYKRPEHFDGHLNVMSPPPESRSPGFLTLALAEHWISTHSDPE